MVNISTITPIKRLTFAELSKLMAEDKIPKIFNQCVIDRQPIAMVNGSYCCVSEITESSCQTCPMYQTRIKAVVKVNTPEIEPLVEDRFVFRAKVISIKNKDGSIRQFVMTVPMKLAKKHGVKDGQEWYAEFTRVRFP